jgi:thiamine pyrophosphokinase
MNSQIDEEFIIDNTFLDKDFLTENNKIDTETFYLSILLNTDPKTDVIETAFKVSNYVVAADGAANLLHEIYSASSKLYLPNIIVGDMDSISQGTLAFFRHKQVEISIDPSQDDNDLEKCLTYSLQKLQTLQKSQTNTLKWKVLIFGGLTGRMDHIMATISALHKFAPLYFEAGGATMLIVDRDSMGALCLPGKTIYTRSKTMEQAKGCGIIPLTGEVEGIETTGFKWNLEISGLNKLTFGNFISTSNEMLSDTISIKTTKPLFFTSALSMKRIS